MNRLKNLLAGDGTVLTAWTSIQDTLYHSALTATNFDAVTLDMQHGMQTEDSVIRGIAAMAPSGKPVIVRIPVGRFDFASRSLDAGANAIIAPMINTLDDAKRLVEFTKYIPLGNRSYGPTQAVGVLKADRDEYVSNANDVTRVFAMIETRQAVENMEAIVALDGIDGVFCGPADLSISVRNNPLPDPYGADTVEIVRDMAQAARAHDKTAAAFCSSAEHVELVHEMGYRLISFGFDSMYLGTGANTLLSQLSFR